MSRIHDCSICGKTREELGDKFCDGKDPYCEQEPHITGRYYRNLLLRKAELLSEAGLGISEISNESTDDL